MRKLAAYTIAAAIGIVSASAYASDSMNGTKISDKGIELSVTGTANLEVPNDEARIHWTASSQEKTLQAATAKVIESMNLATDKLKKIPNLNLQTVNVGSYPVYSESKGNKAPEIVAWRATQGLSIETRNISAIPDIIKTLSGQLQLNSLSFSISDEARAQYNQQLIHSAIADATQQAVWVAESVGCTAANVQVKDIRFHGALPVRPEYAVMRATNKALAADTAVPTPSLESGSSTLTFSVSTQVVIRKKNAEN